MSDKDDFLHTGKHESFLLQIDTMIFKGDGQAFPEFPKWQVCNVCNISKKKLRDKVDFLHADRNESFLRVDFNTFIIKVS